MTHRPPQIVRIITVVALALPALAQAHPGHAGDAGFAAGALHPLTGVDHVSLLVAAGWLASRLSGHARAVLAALLAGLSGAAAAADSGALPYVAGFLCMSAALIAAVASTIVATAGLTMRRVTAAAVRSTT